jgi:four helix bundle protein
MMQDFRKLKVWKQAHALTLDVYSLTRAFPKEELFGLTRQMRRSSSSIPTNIAEGCGRGGDVDFARFVQMSMGSACELEYQLELSRDLGYLANDRCSKATAQTQEVKRMLAGLLTTLRTQRQQLTADS